MKAGVVVSDSEDFPKSLSSEFLGEMAGPVVKFRFRSSRRVSRASLLESSCCSVSGLGLVREARMISCSDGGNRSKNSLSSGDKTARGSSLATVMTGVIVVETDSVLVVVVVETDSVTTEIKCIKTWSIILENLTWLRSRVVESDDRVDLSDTNTAVITVAPAPPDISPPGVQPGGAPQSAPGVGGSAGAVALPSVEEGEHTASFPHWTSHSVTGPGHLLCHWKFLHNFRARPAAFRR